jgi:hypothetical protein
MGAGIPADGTRSDDNYLSTHAFLPAFLAAENSAQAEPITTVEPRRTRRRFVEGRVLPPGVLI